jgi:hypothetical protein
MSPFQELIARRDSFRMQIHKISIILLNAEEKSFNVSDYPPQLSGGCYQIFTFLVVTRYLKSAEIYTHLKYHIISERNPSKTA